MKPVKLLIAICLSIFYFVAGLVCPSFADTEEPTVLKEPVVSGGETQYRARMLTTQIHWYKDLTQAKANAQKNGKLIFWVHMLGDVSGYT